MPGHPHPTLTHLLYGRRWGLWPLPRSFSERVCQTSTARCEPGSQAAPASQKLLPPPHRCRWPGPFLKRQHKTPAALLLRLQFAVNPSDPENALIAYKQHQYNVGAIQVAFLAGLFYTCGCSYIEETEQNDTAVVVLRGMKVAPEPGIPGIVPLWPAWAAATGAPWRLTPPAPA